FPVLTSLYQNRDKSVPYFNFSITYQNHGAYRTDTTYEESFLERGSLSEASYNILNDYLHGIADTSNRMLTFLDSLRDDPEPVAVIFFGDHMPWMGDGNSVLHEAGINIDLATEEGFYNYYGTPYIIWANEAAKAVTGSDFVGEGERVSPGYLMNLLFREWGIEGGAWAQYNASLLDRMEIANTGSSIYRIDGALYTAAMLEGDGKQMVSEHKIAEYYWKRHFAYRSVAG
ncbi:MAG: sulfatase-like hydrolase/transferase, partial [bacterium]